MHVPNMTSHTFCSYVHYSYVHLWISWFKNLAVSAAWYHAQCVSQFLWNYYLHSVISSVWSSMSSDQGNLIRLLCWFKLILIPFGISLWYCLHSVVPLKSWPVLKYFPLSLVVAIHQTQTLSVLWRLERSSERPGVKGKVKRETVLMEEN